MVASRTQRRYTLDDYLSVEEMGSVRHEYLNGEILAMAGGTPEHAALSAAILVLLGKKLEGGPCRPYSSDLRIRVRETGLATCADASVIRGSPYAIRNRPPTSQTPHSLSRCSALVRKTTIAARSESTTNEFSH